MRYTVRIPGFGTGAVNTYMDDGSRVKGDVSHLAYFYVLAPR